MSNADMIELAKALVGIAESNQLVIETCAEQIDLQNIGIKHGSCIDKEWIEKIIGYKLRVRKDINQRIECRCIESVEVGMYNTCKNGCKYCYANFNDDKVKESV